MDATKRVGQVGQLVHAAQLGAERILQRAERSRTTRRPCGWPRG
ncbi:hypothetical protein [Nonomuraea dietziae]